MVNDFIDSDLAGEPCQDQGLGLLSNCAPNNRDRRQPGVGH